MKKHLPLIARVLAALAVLALAWALRWKAITSLPIDYDEDDYLRAGQEYAMLFRARDWAGFLETNYRPEHPALNKIAFGAAMLAAPPSIRVPDRPSTAGPATVLPRLPLRYSRMTSAVFGTLEAFLLALINPLAGLFLAAHTFTIKYTSQVMLEALPAFTSLMAVTLYWQSTRSPTPAERVVKGVRIAPLLLAAMFLGLTAASKYIYAAAGFAILLDWLRFTSPRGGKAWLRWLGSAALWGLLAIGIFILADPYLWPDPIGRLRESLLFHTWYTANAAEVQSASLPFWQPFVWLAQSVPWHPGTFVIAIDAWISLLALVGLPRVWRERPVFVLWLGVALIFLLLWPTKWPQYILILTAPLSLAAAAGAQTIVIEPLVAWWAARDERRAERLRAKAERPARATVRRETRKALPWLVPGLIAFGLLTLFPLLFQLAMALTDFTGLAIKDGLQGGVWREVWLGLTGQVQAAGFGAPSREVHFAGLRALNYALRLVLGSKVLTFEIVWTALSVGLQTALGLGLALLLQQKGLRFKKGWQVLFVLPWAIPESVGAMMWAQIFAPRFGWLSLAIGSFPERIDFPLPAAAFASLQARPGLALVVLALPALWYGFPFMLLAASAGLKLVPSEVYDAAALDGATAWQTLRYVTWPLLLPLLLPAMLIRGIFAFNQFYLFQVLDTPWPLTTLASISFNMLNPVGRGGGQFALSAALNIITALVLVLFIALLNRWTRASEGVTYA